MLKSKRTSQPPTTETPRQVLYSRSVALASVSAEGSVASRNRVQKGVAAVPVSNGVRPLFSVSRVPVQRIVASASRSVASASCAVASAYGQNPPSPKITLKGVIKLIKRAAAGLQSQRIRQRLDQIQSARSVPSVASPSVS